MPIALKDMSAEELIEYTREVSKNVSFLVQEVLYRLWSPDKQDVSEIIAALGLPSSPLAIGGYTWIGLSAEKDPQKMYSYVEEARIEDTAKYLNLSAVVMLQRGGKFQEKAADILNLDLETLRAMMGKLGDG